MTDLPGGQYPVFTAAARDDALFHYTTATGLTGIFDSQSLWGTAYYCANDEEELRTGKGVLTPLFNEEVYRLRKANDPRIAKFYSRGVDPFAYADGFEGTIVGFSLDALCAYLTCFCKPTSEEDFQHGLLSQWRGYGADGGYAIQFSRAKLMAAVQALSGNDALSYEFQDVRYGPKNDLRDEVLKHKQAFVDAFAQELDELAKPIDLNRTTWPSPLKLLVGGPLEALLQYLVLTKNQHFSEERECRLFHVQPTTALPMSRPVRYYNRNGLLVPYVSTPHPPLDILECIEWIIVGPGTRMHARLKSVAHLVRQSGRDISVRVSRIPFTRQ